LEIIETCPSILSFELFTRLPTEYIEFGEINSFQNKDSVSRTSYLTGIKRY